MGAKIENPVDVEETGSREVKKLPMRQVAFGILRQNGVTIENAEKAMGYAPHYGYKLEKKIKKYDLTSSSFVSLAHKNLKKLMKAEPFGSIEVVKDSTALAAIGEVLDRYSPKVRKHQVEGVVLNVTGSVEVLRRFQGDGDGGAGVGAGVVEPGGVAAVEEVEAGEAGGDGGSPTGVPGACGESGGAGERDDAG